MVLINPELWGEPFGMVHFLPLWNGSLSSSGWCLREYFAYMPGSSTMISEESEAQTGSVSCPRPHRHGKPGIEAAPRCVPRVASGYCPGSYRRVEGVEDWCTGSGNSAWGA